ncbi:transcription elongation domain protein [Bordetella holmesii 35009]|nr:transcription elongation domain protein [Bordetella holmesii 35009]
MAQGAERASGLRVDRLADQYHDAEESLNRQENERATLRAAFMDKLDVTKKSPIS